MTTSTYELAGAAKTRVAYHLGRGVTGINVAKKSANAFLCVGVATALVAFGVILLWGRKLASLLTLNGDIQGLIDEVIPLMALGNLSRVFEAMSMSIVEAQGRPKLALYWRLACSCFITIPLAALMVFRFNIDLQGIAAAVEMGHSTGGAVMSYCVFRSNWEGLEIRIQTLEDNEEDADVDISSHLYSTVAGPDFYYPPQHF